MSKSSFPKLRYISVVSSRGEKSLTRSVCTAQGGPEQAAADREHPAGRAGRSHLLVDLHVARADDANPAHPTQPGEAEPVPTLHQHADIRRTGWVNCTSW